MEKTFKIETIITVTFNNSGDYYEEIPNNFQNIKNDLLAGSRAYNYTFNIDREKTFIQEIV